MDSHSGLRVGWTHTWHAWALQFSHALAEIPYNNSLSTVLRWIMFKTFKQHLNNSTNWKVSNINYGLLKLTWTHRNTLSLLTLQQLPPPIKFKPSANPSTLTTNKGHGPQVWLLKTNTYVFNIDSSFYVPTFICRPCKHSHKQNGTMWLQRTSRSKDDRKINALCL